MLKKRVAVTLCGFSICLQGFPRIRIWKAVMTVVSDSACVSRVDVKDNLYPGYGSHESLLANYESHTVKWGTGPLTNNQ
ncbi:hypothetical protein BV22DRAFT_1032029 [Leucogyrophana mollusca]|uniref:Uncharacterized protein n=1 Tax=Leucogyrophana mollusca TaxID=85980 RepID=A0ACB8BN28_9AGAM|nr:hypothetical protein BV22DRAFT_1032029 [Leucogyrophana mollusca]